MEVENNAALIKRPYKFTTQNGELLEGETVQLCVGSTVVKLSKSEFKSVNTFQLLALLATVVQDADRNQDDDADAESMFI